MTNIQNLRMWSFIHYNTSIILFSTGWFGNSSLCNASVQFLVISVIRCWRPWKDIARRTPESSHLDQYRIVGTHQSASEKGEKATQFCALGKFRLPRIPLATSVSIALWTLPVPPLCTHFRCTGLQRLFLAMSPAWAVQQIWFWNCLI